MASIVTTAATKRAPPLAEPRPARTKIAKNVPAKDYSSDSDGPRISTGSVGSGIKLENVSICVLLVQKVKTAITNTVPFFFSNSLQIAVTFKNHVVLKDVSWDVKAGERVGLVGVNGAGKTTQLQVITGAIQPDSGEISKAKANMKIAYLTQEFNVEPTRTLREEFMSAFGEQMANMQRQEEIQKALEECGDDMDKMGKLLDELAELNKVAVELDVSLIDKKIDQMMPELGFLVEENDRLVASYSGGWQMRMCLGKSCCKNLICYYWMNLQIIWTWMPLPGWNSILQNKKYQWLLSLMIVNFWTFYVQRLLRLSVVLRPRIKAITLISSDKRRSKLHSSGLPGRSSKRKLIARKKWFADCQLVPELEELPLQRRRWRNSDLKVLL